MKTENELYQYDMGLCRDSRCWRFSKEGTAKCSNCPYVAKRITKKLEAKS